MRNYRLILLFRGDLAKARREDVIEGVKKLIKTKDIELKDLGEKKLAYPIKGELKAAYSLLTFKSEQVDPSVLTRLEMQDDILRHLLVRDN